MEPLEIDKCFLNQSILNNISVIVCCKNRIDNLIIALSSWLSFTEIEEIIILDFGSDIPVSVPYKDERIKLYRYESKYWHLSKAYNIASQLVTKKYVLKLDCDYYLHPIFFLTNLLLDNMFFTGSVGMSTRGLLFVKKDDFFRVNGYNERIINWGGDDVDMYYRLSKIGLKERHINKNSIKHLPHPNYLRTKYQPNPKLNRHHTNRSNISMGSKKLWGHNDRMSSLYD